jgi:hypothetical protein
MSGRYLCSRLEELCDQPAAEVRRVLAFLGADDPKLIDRGVELVERPASLGRWNAQPQPLIEEAEGAMRAALVRYGYELSVTAAASSRSPDLAQFDARL